MKNTAKEVSKFCQLGMSAVQERFFLLFCLILLIFQVSCTGSKENHIVILNGEWSLHLASESKPGSIDPSSLDYNLMVRLPGTLDNAGIGNPNNVKAKLEREVMLHLHRKVSYTGPAYYKRTVNIPQKWNDKNVTLKLERVLWESVVWVNGKKVGNDLSLSTPHYYDLTEYLETGENTITICVDNSRKFDLNQWDMAHAYTDNTQIIWNGILGDIRLTATNKTKIENLDIYPDFASGSVVGSLISNNENDFANSYLIKVYDKDNLLVASKQNQLPGKISNFLVEIPGDIDPWNEFSPSLYTMEAVLLDQKGETLNTRKESFGFRDLKAHNGSLVSNGEQIFLRGTLECAIFPLTGHPPVEKKGWLKILGSAKEFGLNHIRFHSWCPPKAAFEAADQLGIYLQVELPNWSLDFGKDPGTLEFFYSEADRIFAEYGNHPSFALFSLGNELQGDFDMMTGLITRMKNKDKRRLYTTTSFTFQKGHGLYPETVDDFFITQYTEKGWVRGQGIFDQVPPHFNADYTDVMHHIPVPLITHEIGQYSVFPDMSEIEKYTGVLEPLNFIAVKNDLEEKGLLHLVPEYTMATGKFATLLYKEEIERALKTDGVDGFQLLDIRDFSGQGTALVGVLNAFWEPKGFITAEDWRMFCSEVVPLLWFDKAVYSTNETFEAYVGVANYKDDFHDAHITWVVKNTKGETIIENSFDSGLIENGKAQKLTNVSFDFDTFIAPAKYTIEVTLNGTSYTNKWDFWLYEDDLKLPDTNILITESLPEALDFLENGGSVLLSPATTHINGVDGKFVPVFWSPVHFPNQPGTMGLLVDPDHKAFEYFPTDFHSNWQWWDLSKNSKTLVFDSLDVEPIVRVVDNFFHNRQMTNVFEAMVGEGRLVFSSIDLFADTGQRNAVKQFKYSLLSYMNSDQFNPKGKISEKELSKLFISTDLQNKKIK